MDGSLCLCFIIPSRLSRSEAARSGSAIMGGLHGCSNLEFKRKIPRKISHIGLTCFNDINTFIRDSLGCSRATVLNLFLDQFHHIRAVQTLL